MYTLLQCFNIKFSFNKLCSRVPFGSNLEFFLHTSITFNNDIIDNEMEGSEVLFFPNIYELIKYKK